MAYRLSIAEDLPTSVRACAREQLEGAIAQLDGGKDRVRAVHEARKHLKKARALLRIVRPALGAATYRRENAALRDAARLLSATRDADVLVATVEALADHAAGRLPAASFAAVRDALAREAAAARSAEPAGETAPADPATVVARQLSDVLARVESWPLEGSDWETVVAATSRAYARGRRERAHAVEQPTVEALHAWRKRVKDLWYHHRLLKPVWPPVVEAIGEEAHVLSELLGDDHDLAVLRDRLAAGVELPPGAGADLAPLVALIAQRRETLQRDARQLAARLYAESPKAFERRLGCWVEAAVAEAGT